MVSVGSFELDSVDVDDDNDDGGIGFNDANVCVSCDADVDVNVGRDWDGSLETTGAPDSGLMTRIRSGNFLCWTR